MARTENDEGRERGLLAVLGALGAVAVLGAAPAVAAVTRVGAPAGPGPARTEPTGGHAPAQTVRLDDLAPGRAPALDRLEHDFTYRRADGSTFRLRSPDTLSEGLPYVAAATGLLSLHESADGYAVAVDGGAPVALRVPAGPEDYRFLTAGPRGTAFVPGRPGRLVRVAADGRLSVVRTGGRTAITATRHHIWGLANGRTWRLDPDAPRPRWTAMGVGQEPTGLPSADTVWVAADDRCGAMHDASTYAVLWRRCGLGGTVPELASPDGRYAVLSEGNRRLDVIQTATGRVVLPLDARAGHGIGAGAWSGDELTVPVQTTRGPARTTGWVTCDLARVTCRGVDLPLDLRGIWSPTGAPSPTRPR